MMVQFTKLPLLCKLASPLKHIQISYPSEENTASEGFSIASTLSKIRCQSKVNLVCGYVSLHQEALEAELSIVRPWIHCLMLPWGAASITWASWHEILHWISDVTQNYAMVQFTKPSPLLCSHQIGTRSLTLTLVNGRFADEGDFTSIILCHIRNAMQNFMSGCSCDGGCTLREPQTVNSWSYNA